MVKLLRIKSIFLLNIVGNLQFWLHPQIMDYTALPHFCRRSKSGSSRYSSSDGDDCFSFHHPFHQQLYNHIKRQACKHDFVAPVKQGSFHVTVPEPEPEGTITVETIESELHKIGDTMNEFKIGGAWNVVKSAGELRPPYKFSDACAPASV